MRASTRGRWERNFSYWPEIAHDFPRLRSDQTLGINEPVVPLYVSYSGNVASMSDSSCRMRLKKANSSNIDATSAATYDRNSTQLPTNINQAPV